MTIFHTFVSELWSLTVEMAPYLILGFLIAGLLRVFFQENWVRKHLGKRGLGQILKSVFIGIPLPLCSCGVIPVAAGIRKQGGQRGAVASFTAATPQTGVDAIAASVGMLGWTFTIFRIIIAFVNGIIAGFLVDRFGDGKEENAVEKKTSGCCCEKEKPEPKPAESCCSSKGQPAQSQASVQSRLKSGLYFGLVTLPKDLKSPLLLGIFIAAIISSIVPDGMFADIPGGQLSMYVVVTLISLPLYVCSTGSIPMALTLIHAGISPGSAIIFLIAGPATNVATVTSLVSLIGKRSTLLYVISIIVVSWGAALIADTTNLSLMVTSEIHYHEMSAPLWKTLSGIVLVAILGYAGIGEFRSLRRTSKKSDCCSN